MTKNRQSRVRACVVDVLKLLIYPSTYDGSDSNDDDDDEKVNFFEILDQQYPSTRFG